MPEAVNAMTANQEGHPSSDMRTIEEMHKRQDELDDAMRKRHAEIDEAMRKQHDAFCESIRKQNSDFRRRLRWRWRIFACTLIVLAASVAAVFIRVKFFGY